MNEIWTKGGNARREEVFLRAYAGEGIRRDEVEHRAQQTPADLPACIDHTLVRPEVTRAMVEQLCREAIHHRFATVCVTPRFVPLCSQLLQDTGVGVGTVVAFPSGASDSEIKALEARRSIQLGATEIDMVLAVGALLGGETAAVYRDLAAVRRETMGLAVLKVVIESALLTNEQQELACRLALDAGADYVATGTGLDAGVATEAAVRLMRRTVGGRIGVKAFGGIPDLAAARSMLAAGANRLGTTSGSAIMGGISAQPE